MEVIGGILVALIGMVLLAALGLTTVVAFGLMALLGLITEWNFRRVFFVSFALGLFAPILAAAAIGSAIEDGTLGNDLRDGIAQVFPASEQMSRNWQEIGPRIEEVERSVEAGEIDREEARERIEQVINEQTGIQIDLEGIPISEDEATLRIEVD